MVNASNVVTECKEATKNDFERLHNKMQTMEEDCSQKIAEVRSSTTIIMPQLQKLSTVQAPALHDDL